jgi:geranylgeranyl pyrophosphate synthase
MSATLVPSTAPRPLAEFLEWARSAVDAELDNRLRVEGDDPGRLAEAMHYAATGPGKRLRPALLLAAAEACALRAARLPDASAIVHAAAERRAGRAPSTDPMNESEHEKAWRIAEGRANALRIAMPAAAAIEMLHAYTLVHDDLPAMDDDDERRGRPTVHIAFGEAIAILAGDALLTKAFEILAEGVGGRAVAVLARRAGSAELLRGQAIDLTTPRESLKDLPSIERMHAAKTGALFAAAAELGGIAAGAPAEICTALGTYGMAIGIAFQHADDRDDAELTEYADAAAARMRELCDEALTAVRPLGSSILDELARWIASRA